jgi:tetratricopeptide (TPR) repeat protein
MHAWADSPYAASGAARVDSVEAKTCVQCHMAKVDASQGDAAADSEGKVSSHHFLGAHTWLAAVRKDEDQLARSQRFLEGVATIDAIGGLSVQSGTEATSELVVDIVVRNTGVGHRFPSGVRDVANTWIEVEILATDGTVSLRSSAGTSAHRLSAYLADEHGDLLHERETHRFAALVADHTIAPRDVAVTRYRGVLPRGQRVGHIRARLVHQSRGNSLAKASCEESKSARGQAYAAASRSLAREEIDACVAQPLTIIAEVTRAIGDSAGQSFTRSYEHGLGLLHEVQERVDIARPSLEAALSLAAGDNKKEAMALVALAKLEARLGRADEAVGLLRRAQVLAPTSAAVFAQEGEALARVWRWPGAADAYAKAIALAPGNASLWRRYALALGSTGSHAEALLAAQRGLQLLPRDADLLRVQALSLRAVGHADASKAMKAYLEHRGPDNVGAIRLLCAQKSALCARESMPVHEHALLSVSRR